MNFRLLEGNADNYVTHVFESPHVPRYPYHNIEHTRSVVNRAREIGSFYRLVEADLTIMALAAWFHDIGQVQGKMEEYEERGRHTMKTYLGEMKVPDSLIAVVGDCILATKKNAYPKNLLEKILCDSDTYHFGTAEFKHTEFSVKLEVELRTGKNSPRWHETSLLMLQDHVYYTEYCQLMRSQGKKANVAWLHSLSGSIPTVS